MTSRRFIERIEIHVRSETVPAVWAKLCDRRASVDQNTLEIVFLWDQELSGLDWQKTRIHWYSRGGLKVLNLRGITITSGRQPMITCQATSDQFKVTEDVQLMDVSGNEIQFIT